MKLIGLPPLKYKWTKAYLLRPIDNIVSHPDSLLKRPFRPSFQSHGAPYLPCLLRYDYFRIWKQEQCHFQECKAALTKQPKKKFSPYRKQPIKGTYCGGSCAKPQEKMRFVMKQFQCVPAKVDHRRIYMNERHHRELVNAVPLGTAGFCSAPACC